MDTNNYENLVSKLPTRLSGLGLIFACIALGLAVYANPKDILFEVLVVAFASIVHGYLYYRYEKLLDKYFNDELARRNYGSVYVPEPTTITKSYIRNRSKHEGTAIEPKHLSQNLSKDELDYYGKIMSKNREQASKYNFRKEKQ